MKPFELCLTHDAQAHLDEFVTVGLILAGNPSLVVERRAIVHGGELDDPAVVVIDTGRRHEPALSNFDHHQFERGVTVTTDCSLSLYLRHLGHYELAEAAWPWLHRLEIQDNGGIKEVARHYHMASPRNVIPLLSPVEKVLLEMFSAASVVRPDDLLHTMLRRTGESMLLELDAYEAQLALLKAHTTFLKTRCGKVMMKVSDELIGPPSFGHEAFCLLHHPEVDIIVSADTTHEGWTVVSRHGDTNFALAGSRVKLNFVHEKGYVAKTKRRVGDDDLRWLVNSCHR